MAIGASAEKTETVKLGISARERAARLPDLLIEAACIANHAILGWHGRRKRGTGETFWQFRPYVEGEPVQNIDWRRSARDDQPTLRDREWEGAQTIWIAIDQTQSMFYRSQFALHSKIDHALLLAFILGDLFSRSGERIGIPSLMRPTNARNVAEKMAFALTSPDNKHTLPDLTMLNRFCDIVLIGDFLDDPDVIISKLQHLSERNIRAHLVEVFDPAEQNFPYKGRIEFCDPENGKILLAGQAQTYREDYQKLYLARRQTLTDYCNRQGWSYTLSPTDKSLNETILHLATVFQAATHTLGENK